MLVYVDEPFMVLCYNVSTIRRLSIFGLAATDEKAVMGSNMHRGNK